MLPGTVFIIVLLGSVMRRKDIVETGIHVDLFKTLKCLVQA